jgi:protein TonB
MVRFLSSLGLAGVITVGLFFLMHSLIKMGKMDLGERSGRTQIDFIRTKTDSETQTRKRILPTKKQVTKDPTPPKLSIPKASVSAGGGGMNIAPPAPAIKSIRLAGGPSLGGAPSDAGETPLVRIQPMYPRYAAERRIEGWVELAFTISVTGSVKNARVIKAKPANVFNRAALKAIKKWKYRPKIVNGTAVEKKGIRVRLTFELKDYQQ